MMTTRTVILSFVCLLVVLPGMLFAQALTPQQQLGEDLFFDQNLSANRNQSCAACHHSDVGWTGPDELINQHGAVYEGSIAGRFGNRKPPSSAYAPFSPVFHFSRKAGGMFIGGNFWDGRATGDRLGNPAAEQAQGPFLNPLEQALPDVAAVLSGVCFTGTYTDLFSQICGQDPCAPKNVADAYDCIGFAIAAYEASKEVSAFSSKFDAHLAGHVKLTSQERRGLDLFNGNAKCARCHVDTGKAPLFTDFTYDNLGVPRNPENPFYNEPDFNPLGAAWIDLGLGGFLATTDFATFARSNMGKFKVPTLRNVDKRPSEDFVKAYSHNGFFKSLESIVHFYNTRDVLPVCPVGSTDTYASMNNCWPLPELALNMNTKEVGDLGLTSDEEAAIVAFLKALSDGFVP